MENLRELLGYKAKTSKLQEKKTQFPTQHIPGPITLCCSKNSTPDKYKIK